MTVLVTGGAGYIGSHVVLALRDRGKACVVIDDLSTGSKSLLPGDVELVAGDIGDATLIGRLIERHRITSIVHLAASTSVPDSIRQPLLYYANNAAKTCTRVCLVICLICCVCWSGVSVLSLSISCFCFFASSRIDLILSF